MIQSRALFNLLRYESYNCVNVSSGQRNLTKTFDGEANHEGWIEIIFGYFWFNEDRHGKIFEVIII